MRHLGWIAHHSGWACVPLSPQLQTVQGHAGVIRLLGLEEDAFSWFLIMERCDLDLQELLTRVPCGFPAPRAASWFLALAEGQCSPLLLSRPEHHVLALTYLFFVCLLQRWPTAMSAACTTATSSRKTSC